MFQADPRARWSLATIATGAARTRARSFALAFGVRNLCWGFAYLAAVWGVWRGTHAEVPTDPYDPTYIIYMLGTPLAVPLIAYGILQTQLFGIDLRDTLEIPPADADALERDLQARQSS